MKQNEKEEQLVAKAERRNNSCLQGKAGAVINAAVGMQMDKELAQSLVMHVEMDKCIKEGARNQLLRKKGFFNSNWCDKGKIDEYLKCLEGIHTTHGMTDQFIHVFNELYEEALTDGIMPCEEGKWKKIRVSQVLHNLRRARKNNDKSHFTWFMYMLMRFTLGETKPKDQHAGKEVE